MVKKLDQFLFSKVNSSYSEEELSILYNQIYIKYKSDLNCSTYLIEADFQSFLLNFANNLTEEQKIDFENINKERKGFFSTLFSAISGFYLLGKKYKKTEEGKVLLVRFTILNEIQKEVFNSIYINKKSLNNIKFSQTEIANEFKVDKKTLSKWFELVNFKDKYFGRKQLSFFEYNQIFKKLFTESDEDFDLENNLKEFIIRLEEKKTISKKDIIRLAFKLKNDPKVSDYERAQEIIQENNDFDFYSKVDKYPYSIAIKIINYLKDNYEQTKHTSI